MPTHEWQNGPFEVSGCPATCLNGIYVRDNSLVIPGQPSFKKQQTEDLAGDTGAMSWTSVGGGLWRLHRVHWCDELNDEDWWQQCTYGGKRPSELKCSHSDAPSADSQMMLFQTQHPMQSLPTSGWHSIDRVSRAKEEHCDMTVRFPCLPEEKEVVNKPNVGAQILRQALNWGNHRAKATHVADGTVSNELYNFGWLASEEQAMKNVDLRDPPLAETPVDRLMAYSGYAAGPKIYEKLTVTHDIVRATRTKCFPLTVSFEDGNGVKHQVTVAHADGEVELHIPLSNDVSVRMVNSYKFIGWQGDDLKERTAVDPKSTIAHCRFVYEPKSTCHNHGIRISVTSFARPGNRPGSVQQTVAKEKTYWADLVDRVRKVEEAKSKVIELGNAESLKSQGFSANILWAVGARAEVLKQIGFTAAEMLAALQDSRLRTYNGGFEELCAMGATGAILNKGLACGALTADVLTGNGVPASWLFQTGYPREKHCLQRLVGRIQGRIQNLGELYRKDTGYREGYTLKQLKAAGLNPQELSTSGFYNDELSQIFTRGELAPYGIFWDAGFAHDNDL